LIGFSAKRRWSWKWAACKGATNGEKSLERLVQRNGCRDRDWKMRAGTVELRTPKLRKAHIFSQVCSKTRGNPLPEYAQKMLNSVLTKKIYHDAR
jgi:transposase-like protein